ncbi:hypothetical protein [Spartinivicinus poritis]|uniref:Uncharacterized protein n=1 Tax=Spartinivicinus poritis TaxID=2994640 RepID=A0ABT5U9D9_9GAMM|nr:hypothetical protein [Spartinivicinus sp. A2-2]MDE1462177.1 hypothetical protein [Spartinivicinus sp. A2-2]
MSENKDTKRDKPCYSMGIKPEDAAAAAVAQSFANSAQDQVDAIRNRNIIKATAMGNAFAKWLNNPMMKDEYKAIIDEAQLYPKAETPMNLGREIFNYYLGKFEENNNKKENVDEP